MRLLIKIEVGQIERSLIASIQKLIRNKKFVRYLINGYYPIAIDGTQKMTRDYIWSEQCQERTVGKENQKHKQYYVYVLEASFAFQNGMTIPLMSEFLSYTEGDTERKKQDCEIKAFKRLARRLKSTFKKLPIMLLLDGLYANGPVMQICHDNRWDYMIVLKDDSLITVWRVIEYFNVIIKAYIRAPGIVLILDNAKYFKAKIVREWLEKHPKLELKFLPPYAPNLNLIERFWRFVKEHLVKNRYYKKYKTFRAKVFQFIKN
jgi:transposase